MSYIEPNNNDVLKGRGRTINDYYGNRQFRKFVREIQREYVQAPKEEKPFYAKHIIAKIASLSPPGRFLKYDDETNAWCEMSKKEAADKTRMALRDKAPQIRSELEAFRVGTAGDTDSPTPTVPRPPPPFSIIHVDGTFRSVATSLASYSPPMQSNDGNIMIPSASFGIAGTSAGSLPHYPANMRPISAVSNTPSFLAPSSSNDPHCDNHENMTHRLIAHNRPPSAMTSNTYTRGAQPNELFEARSSITSTVSLLTSPGMQENAISSDPYGCQTFDAAAIQPTVNPPAPSLHTTNTWTDSRNTDDQPDSSDSLECPPPSNGPEPDLKSTHVAQPSSNLRQPSYSRDTYEHAGRVDGLNPSLSADMNAMPWDPYDGQTHDAAEIQPAVNPPAQSLPTTNTQADSRNTDDQPNSLDEEMLRYICSTILTEIDTSSSHDSLEYHPPFNGPEPDLKSTHVAQPSSNQQHPLYSRDTTDQPDSVDGLMPPLPITMNAMPFDSYGGQARDVETIDPTENPPASSCEMSKKEAENKTRTR